MPKKRTKNHPLYPEPGTYVLQSYDGLPKQSPPPPLSTEQLSANEVKDHISYEGLGYCIHSFIPPEKIADLRLRALWNTAEDALKEVIEYLETIKPPRESKLKRAKKKKRRFRSKRKTQTNWEDGVLKIFKFDDTEEL